MTFQLFRAQCVLRLWLVPPRSRPRSFAGWTRGHCSSPGHACQTSPQTASHPALFLRNLVSEDSTMEVITFHSEVLGVISLPRGHKWTKMSFTFNYLCVRVQREQLQSGLVPHPRLDISCALRRGKAFSKFKPHTVWNMSNIVWEISSQLVLSGGTSIHFSAAHCNLSNCFPVNWYNQFPCTYGFVIACYSAM